MGIRIAGISKKTSDASYVTGAAARIGTAPGQGSTAALVANLLERVQALESLNIFTEKRDITVDNTAGPAKPNATPVRVLLTSSNMAFAKARSDGRDLQVRGSDGAMLPHWVFSYDAVGQTAEIWVLAPPPGSGSVTVTMRYGSSSWVAPWKITDVFPVGVDFKSLRGAWTHPTVSTATVIFTADEGWETTSGAHTVALVDFGDTGKMAPNGTIYRFWAYYGHYGSDGIGVAFSNSATSGFVKYASNPILTGSSRWPTLKVDDAGNLHMIVHNTTSNDLRRYSIAADGVTATFVEIVAADSGFQMGNPFLFRDPATGEYILWLFRQRVSDTLQQVGYRRSRTIPGLTQAKTIVLQSSPLVWAAPAMVYFDGLYWLYTEDYDNSGQLWRTVVQTSTSPFGGFTPCSNSTLLTADEPCARPYVIDDVLHIYHAQRLNQANTPASNWRFAVRTATPVKGNPTVPATLNSPDGLHSYSLFGQPVTQADTTLGAGAPAPLSGRISGVGATTNVDKSVLAKSVLPANHILAARVAKNASPNVFFGARADVNGNRYRFDMGGNTGHIDTSAGWHTSGTHIVTTAISGWSIGAFHLVECVCLGTTISAKIDGATVLTVTDATYSAGGYCSVETPNGTDMTLDYVYARPYDGTDPIVTVGAASPA